MGKSILVHITWRINMLAYFPVKFLQETPYQPSIPDVSDLVKISLPLSESSENEISCVCLLGCENKSYVKEYILLLCFLYLSVDRDGTDRSGLQTESNCHTTLCHNTRGISEILFIGKYSKWSTSMPRCHFGDL